MINSKLHRQRASLPIYADDDDVFCTRQYVIFDRLRYRRRALRFCHPVRLNARRRFCDTQPMDERRRSERLKTNRPGDGFPIINPLRLNSGRP
jgi:hypothetical protein